MNRTTAMMIKEEDTKEESAIVLPLWWDVNRTLFQMFGLFICQWQNNEKKTQQQNSTFKAGTILVSQVVSPLNKTHVAYIHQIMEHS